MQEKPNIPRTRVSKNAKIISTKHARMVDCTITNVTSRGASLDTAGLIEVPNSFDLTLDGGRTLRACRVIWRRNERLGVVFKHWLA